MIILKLFPNPIKDNMVKDREAFMSLGKKIEQESNMKKINVESISSEKMC